MSVTIYHNPRCSKSREALQLLKDNNIDHNVVEYLLDTPSKSEIKSILRLLGISARQLLRTKEAEYKQLGLDDNNLSDDKLIDAMIKHPKLIERPIVVSGNKAVIGRPPQNVLEIIE